LAYTPKFADLYDLGNVEGWGSGKWAFFFTPDADTLFQGNFPAYRANDAEIKNGETLDEGKETLVVDPTAYKTVVKDLVYKQSDAIKISLEREGFEAEELKEDTTNRPNLVTGTVIFFESDTVLPEGIQVDTEGKTFASGDTVPRGWGTLRVLKERTPVNLNPGTTDNPADSTGFISGDSGGGGGGGCTSSGLPMATVLFFCILGVMADKAFTFKK
jgi:hypothetical protein